jgi:hypothetical protein
VDTDDLTEEAYDILVKGAYEVSEYLGAEIGVMSNEYDSEPEYIDGVAKYVRKIIKDANGYLDGWNLLDEVDPKIFSKQLRALLEKITEMQNIPYDKRKQPDW